MAVPSPEKPPHGLTIEPASVYASIVDRRSRTQNREPFHRTVIMTDVAGFSARDNRTQLIIRDQMYRLLACAFDACGADWSNWPREDRGDGVLIIVPPDVSKARLLGNFPSNLAEQLRRHAHRNPNTGFDLRVAINAGDIVQDDHGHSGPAINHTARLLDTQALRTVLTRSGGPLALAVSDTIYDNIVRHGYNNIDSDGYQHVTIYANGARESLWVHVPTAHPPLPGIPWNNRIHEVAAAGVPTLVITGALLLVLGLAHRRIGTPLRSRESPPRSWPGSHAPREETAAPCRRDPSGDHRRTGGCCTVSRSGDG